MKHGYFLFVLPAVLFIADRIAKYLAPSISIEGGFLKFGLYQNYSGAFSLPLAGSLYNIAGIVFILIFIFLFLMSLRAKRSNLINLGIAASPLDKLGAPRNDSMAHALIFFGGLSNIFDRLYYGYVIDYFNFIGRSFFNIADAMLIMGIVTLLYCHMAKDKKRVDNLTI